MDKERLSIIIPVYNAEDYLDRCLHSILAQDFTSYEVILVDDGSVDSSPLICDRYSATDSRFKTVHKKNGGVSSARNAGLELAKGEYVMFLDSDDALLPFALDDMMDIVCGEDMVVGGYASFIDGVPVKDVRPAKTASYRGTEYPLFFQNNIRRNCDMLDAPWAKLFKRKAIGKIRFCEELSYAEDKLFVFTVMASCSSIITFSGAVYAYHIRQGSLGSDVVSDRHLMQLRRFLPMYADVLSKLEERCPTTPKVKALYHRDLVGRYACRVLNIFATRRTSLLTKDYLTWLYGMMSKDAKLGVFSLRPGQFFNIILFKIGNVAFARSIYKFTSSVSSLLRKK